MGIKYAHVYSYILTDRSAIDVFRIALARLEERNKKIIDTTLHRLQPTIDIDVSLLIRSRGNNNIKANSTYLIHFAETLIQIGFDVMMVFDGITRHHSKRITTQRQADAKRKKIEIVIRKAELMCIAQRRRTLDSIEERNKLLEDEETLKKKIRSLEKFLEQATIDVGDKLYNAFKDNAKKLTASKVKNLHHCQSIFQADSIMAGRIISGESDILLTSDSDQLALLGGECLAIKKWKFRSQEKNKTLESLDIFTANQSTMNNILNILNLPLDTKFCTPPKFQIFENINSYRLRSLLAIVLGCDCNLNAIVTPTQLHKFIKESPLMHNISDEDAYYAIKKILYTTT